MNKREIGLFLAAFGLAGISIVAACSSESSVVTASTKDGGIVIDARAGDVYTPNYEIDAAGEPTYTGVSLDNTRCLKQAHDVDDGGEIACQLLVFFSPKHACDGGGLGAAPLNYSSFIDSDLAGNGAPLPTGNFCALDQLSSFGPPDEAGAGWSYISDSCGHDGGCAQAICASGDIDAGVAPYTAFLICPP